MRARLLLFPVAAALLGLAACDLEDLGGFQKYQKDFHFSYPLKAGGSVSVESFNGSVEVSGWEQDVVDIAGVKYGPTAEAADSLQIDVSNSPQAVSIRAVRPSDRRSNQGARFTIRIPRTATLDRISTSNAAIRTVDGAGPAKLRTSNGLIRVQDLKGSLDAQTSNGAVELIDVAGDAVVHSSNGRIRADNLRGSLDASTSNGSIQANIAQSGRPVRLDTSNGSVDLTLPPNYSNDLGVSTSNASITLRLPGQPNAHVIAHAGDSSITCDFEIKSMGVLDKNRLDGTLGAGGPLFDLGTSNGSIRLLKM
ncbi:MAG: DUF4097 family beta strand repeat-containing protein [Bryobacteraceae bacterium]|jgi:DUF4097 and DUF4098 domain-containing protein YvlB